MNASSDRNGRRRGRPSLFTPRRVEKLLDAVRMGMSYKLAAAYAGVSYDTFNRWRIEGEDEEAPQEYRDFCEALEQAKGEAAYRLASRIDEASTKDWRAAAWILERRHPKEWGKGGGDIFEMFG